MTLGFYAPLPPSRTGVAAYAVRMLEALQKIATVKVNAPGNVNLYHVGNNRLHAAIYRRALEEPGIVVLHDALLQHLLIGTSEEQDYVEEFVYNYGEWNRGLGEELWRGRARVMSDPAYFRYPMLRRLAERSLAVLVHSETAEHAVIAHVPSARVRRIPHLALDAPGAAPDPHVRSRYRREKLGLSDTDFLLGVYGYLRESKRVPSALAALDGLRAIGIPARLLVAGDFASEDYERRLLPDLLGHPDVRYRPSTDDAEFRLLMASADVCVNLKYPSAGESSGIAVRAMALGLPLLLSEGGDGDAFPKGTFVPVLTGAAETGSLAEVLAWLFREAPARRALGQMAMAYCAEHLAPERIGKIVCEIAAECREFGMSTRVSGSTENTHRANN